MAVLFFLMLIVNIINQLRFGINSANNFFPVQGVYAQVFMQNSRNMLSQKVFRLIIVIAILFISKY